jgi:large subunit ribosomal protein L30
VGSLKVQWVKGYIGRTKDQRDTIRSLGFKRLNEERILKNTPEIRGMVKKVIHLLRIVEDVQ